MLVNGLIFPTINNLYALGLVIAAIMYFIFSLIVLRQVNLMTETVQTEGAPILKALAYLHAFLALGVILILIGWLL